MKVGDYIKVDYLSLIGERPYKWSGLCTWTDGYKYEFLIDNSFETWTSGDLETVGAKVINENE